jgi:SPP1 family phage portal protein
MIFTIPAGSSLTKTLIEEAIDWNESQLERYNTLNNYYIGNHKILTRKRGSDLYNSEINTKIVVNHCKYITEMNVGFLLGRPIEYSCDTVEIDEVKEQFKKQSIADLDIEIARNLSIFGRAYELVYLAGEEEGEKEVRSKDIDARNCVVAYDDTVEHNKVFAVIYEKGEKADEYTRVEVYTNESFFDCLDEKNKIKIPTNKKDIVVHKFGSVPIVEYRNDSDFQGDFEQVIPLNDAYNLLQSDRVNDKEQSVDSILVGIGVKLTPAQKSELKKHKMLFGNPPDSDIKFLTKNLDESQVDILRRNLKEDIHKISMTPDLSDEKFAGNLSGVALKYKLLAFEQKASNKERNMAKGLLERFALYNAILVEINKGKPVPLHEVEIVFTRNLPQNDLEVAQMINILSHILPEKTLAEQLSFVPDAETEIKAKEEEANQKANAGTPEFGSGKPNK